MQSIFQYRNIRKIVEGQLNTDRAKSISRGRNETVSPATSSGYDDKDLEKGIDGSSIPAGTIDLPQWNIQDNEPQRELHEEPIMDEEPDEDEDDEDDGDDDRDLSRQRTLSRVSTRQSSMTRLGNVLSGVQVRRRTTNEGGEGNVFVVSFRGDDDPIDPHHWPLTKRVGATMCVAAIGCVVGIASAIDSIALMPAAEEFHVAPVVESCATGLFLIGFGAGSLFAGPISETVGRNPVYIATLILYMIFVMASGLAPNIGAQLAFRFIAGFFGSTPLTCAGGSLSDLWNPLERVYTFPIFANAAFTGPLLGPVIGGYLVQYLDWRWTEWITLIISGLVLSVVVLFQPETYPPLILKWKAKHLREITGDDRYRSQIEIRRESFIRRLRIALYRPFLLTVCEPIIICIALYLTMVYIVLFTFLDGYDYIFTDTYGISPGLTGICFVGIIIGLCCATLLVPTIYKWAKRDLEKIKAEGGSRLPPEFRLWFSMLGGSFAIPISLFWMAWTAYPSISIWSPLAASVVFGYGILCVFITCYQYIIDSYETYAASALASMTMIRYVAAGGMTIVGIPFYENLGVHYTLTILACLTIPLVPLPYVFYKYGSWIRSKSKYAISTTTG